MIKLGRIVNAVFAVTLSVGIMSLTGCGGKAGGSTQETKNNVPDRYEEAEDPAAEWEESGDYEDSDDYADLIGGDDDSGMSGGPAYKINLEGNDSAELDGKIASIVPTGSGCVIANTAAGDLFFMTTEEVYYFMPEDSKVKTYKITDNSGIDELLYANDNTAFGNGSFVYFQKEWVPEDEWAMPEEGGNLPEYIYTFTNLNQANLADAKSLLMVADNGNFYAYVNDQNGVSAGGKDAYSDESITYSVKFCEDETEKSDVVVEKGIYNFVLTKDNELFCLRNSEMSGLFGDEKNAILNYIDITDQINGKITDIYPVMNSTDYCYVVDEDNQIYFVEAVWSDEITVSLIAKFDDGAIEDIQGTAGSGEAMLIRTSDGSYYFHDGDSDRAERIETLDSAYKNVVWLTMDENILALGNDGYLYLIRK